jgi:subtilase family serine protease
MNMHDDYRNWNNCSCANVTPYTPVGWDDCIVISTVPGTNSAASTIYENQILYLDGALTNDGTCDISDSVFIRVYVDDELKANYYCLGLGFEYYVSITDINLGTVSAGSHNFRITGDEKGYIHETNENDNEIIRTITILSLPSRYRIVIPEFHQVFPNPVSDELMLEMEGGRPIS